MQRVAVAVVLVLALTGMPLAVVAQGTDSARVQRLLEALADRSYKVRLQAALAFSHIRDRRAVPALIRTLDDPHALVRGMAASALGLIRDTRAVAPLREHLQDGDALVRQRVVVALEEIRRGGRTPPGRSAVLLRLGGMGDKTSHGRSRLPELRRLWAQQIERSPGVRLAPTTQLPAGQKVYEVNSAITQLRSQRRGDTLETTCSVSLVVGDYKGSIVMMTSGGVTVTVQSQQQGKHQESQQQASALQGAISSAHSNLLKFLATR